MAQATIHTLAQKLANPAWRASVATSKLPPALQAQRQAQQKQKRLDATLYDPTSVLSGGDLRRAVNAEVDMATRPAMSALDQEKATTLKQHSSLGQAANDYWKQWAGRSADELTAARGISDTAMTNQRATDDAAGAAMKGITDGAGAQANQAAGVRGTFANDGRDQMIADLARRQADTTTRAQADQTALGATSAAADRYAVGRAGVVDQKGGEFHRDLFNRTNNDLDKIATARRDLVAKRGDMTVDTTNKLRQTQFDNLITTRGLGLKQEQLQSDAAIAASRIAEGARQADQRNSTARRGQDKSAAAQTRGQDLTYAAAMARLAKLAGKGGLTPSQVEGRSKAAQVVMDKIDNARRDVGDFAAAFAKDGTKLSVPDAKALLRKRGFDDYVIEAAFSKRHHKGKLTPDVVKMLNAHHVPVPTSMRMGSAMGPAVPRPTVGPAGPLG